MFVTPVFTALEYASFEAFGVGTVAGAAGPRGGSGSRRSWRSCGPGGRGRPARRAHRRPAARHQLRLRHVESRGADGVDDDGAARGRRGPPMRGGPAAGVGLRRRRGGRARVVHQGVGGLPRRRARARRDGHDRRRQVRAAAGAARLEAPPARVAGAWLALAGMAASAGVDAAAFVLPHWTEYRFYNWQMSVVRASPRTRLRDLMDRASWLPIVQDFFTRMWLVVAAAAIADRRPRRALAHRAAGRAAARALGRSSACSSWSSTTPATSAGT